MPMPVTFDVMKANFDFVTEDKTNSAVGSAEIHHINLSHPNGGYGYKIVENGKSFVFLTDNELDYHHEEGLTLDEYIAFSKNADLLMHDAQYTDDEYKRTKSWGHTTFRSATDFSTKAEVKRFGIFHHDPGHKDHDMDGFVFACQTQIQQAKAPIECFGVREGMELKV